MCAYLLEKEADMIIAEHNVWACQAPFCAFRYIHNSRYLSVDEAMELPHVRNVGKRDVELYQTGS